MEDLPGNSHTARIQKEKSDEPIPIDKKIVEGEVKERPKTLGGKFKDMFIADGVNFSGQLYENIVKPKVQELALTILGTVLDGLKDGAEEIITGRSGRSSTRPSRSGIGPRNHTPYNRIRPAVPVRDSQRFSDRVTPIRRSNQVAQIIVSSREEGEAVIEALEAQIDSGGDHCTVGDYYDLLGRNVEHTDHKWGWTDLRDARVRMLGPDEYLMVMPTPRPIAN